MLAEQVETKEQDGCGDARSAACHDGAGKIDACIGERLSQRVAALPCAVRVQQLAIGQVDRAGYMAGREAGPGFRLFSRKRAGPRASTTSSALLSRLARTSASVRTSLRSGTGERPPPARSAGPASSGRPSARQLPMPPSRIDALSKP